MNIIYSLLKKSDPLFNKPYPIKWPFYAKKNADPYSGIAPYSGISVSNCSLIEEHRNLSRVVYKRTPVVEEDNYIPFASPY